MKTDSISLRSEKLFPFHFQVLGAIFLFGGIIFVFDTPIFGTILIFSGAFILTEYRGIKFDRRAKSYQIYYSFLLLKFGETKGYEDAVKMYINSVKVSQKIYTMVTTGITSRNIEYNAYLKLIDGTKLYLTSNRDKKLLFDKLSNLADFFGLDIVDNTV